MSYAKIDITFWVLGRGVTAGQEGEGLCFGADDPDRQHRSGDPGQDHLWGAKRG